MAAKKDPSPRRIPAIKVRQWLPSWDDISWNPKAKQAKPPEFFYLFTIDAAELKALTGVYQRSTKDLRARADDPYIQRGREDERADKIREFVAYGFPWCEMSESKRTSGRFSDLKKPGWLPTAIVVNILTKSDARKIEVADLIDVKEARDSLSAEIILPKTFSDADWRCKSIPPMEVIDGQHRLWAFENCDYSGDYELPVVAFHGLDRSWQAYLFWSINVTPKRINKSLAFDLYPLLRTEDWLERFHGHSIYRETRAQELVEALWSHPESPWHQRINMLGERGLNIPMVTQAAWIRSLLAACLKQWEGRGTQVGGLFGAPIGEDQPVLPWSRAQQAAFLIAAGQALRAAVKSSKVKWATELRKGETKTLFQKDDDPAFYGRHSLIATDQGIRGFLFVINDLCYMLADDLQLAQWQLDAAAATDQEEVTKCLRSLKATQKKKTWQFLEDIAGCLESYDWRTSSAPGLPEDLQQLKAGFRGSGGYRLLRLQLLEHLGSKAKGELASAAKEVKSILE